MEFLGGISGMDFNPISNYNNFIKENKSFDVDTSSMDFETILNNQTAAMQNPMQIQGGVEKTNFDDIFNQATVQATSVDNKSTGDFMKSFSSAVGGGLNSVNNSIEAANKAQEALAMGEDVSVHDVMIASEKAALSMQMTMQLRNKLMSAYTELNNIRV